jgi:hypothetical protein
MVGRVACSAGVQFRRLRGAGVVWVGEGKGEVGPLAARGLRCLRMSETSSVVQSLVHALGAWPRPGPNKFWAGFVLVCDDYPAHNGRGGRFPFPK